MTPEQRTHAIVHNAADRALSSRGYWVSLGVRSAITEAVLAALAAQGKAVVDVSDLVAAITVLATADDTCADAACWREACQLLARLRAALPDVALEPSGTLQDAETSGDGTRGHLGPPNGSASLSGLRERIVAATYNSEDACPRCKSCDRQHDAVMAVVEEVLTRAEEALDAAQQTIARTVRYAIAQASYRPVEAGSLAAVLLNIDPHDIDPDEAIRALETQGASLTKENHRDA